MKQITRPFLIEETRVEHGHVMCKLLEGEKQGLSFFFAADDGLQDDLSEGEEVVLTVKQRYADRDDRFTGWEILEVQ